jgi:hypothetical protein
MATVTVGTAGTTTLTGVVYSPSAQVMLPADVGAMNAGILDDQNVAHPAAHLSGVGGLTGEGMLIVPNRGTLKLLPGDVVAFDPTTGGVVLITALAAAGGDWIVS